MFLLLLNVVFINVRYTHTFYVMFLFFFEWIYRYSWNHLSTVIIHHLLFITLHWLPVRARSKFKILLMAHRIVHDPDSIPTYLSSSFSTTKHARTTRFNLSNTLKTDYSFRLITVGGRSIFVAIRDLWNTIPENLRDIASFSRFKANVKTFLFKEAYGC